MSRNKCDKFKKAIDVSASTTTRLVEQHLKDLMACSTEKKQHKTDINGLYFNFKTVSDDRVEKWNGLTLAVDHTLTDLITQLFEKGADPNVRTSNNKTALAVAVTAQFKSGGQDDTEMIECLLDNGAEVDVKFVQDNTILHLAVLVQHTGLVKSLINHGANTALMNAKKDTPMMMAFKYRKDDAFQLLKEAFCSCRDCPPSLG